MHEPSQPISSNSVAATKAAPAATPSARAAGSGGRPSEAYLEAVQAAAGRGWHVFPVYEIDARKRCACARGAACPDAGKHPRITGNLIHSTNATAQLERWNSRWPNCNWGVDCAKSGLAVIDVDLDRGGERALAALEQAHGRLPHTPRVQTGGGGTHLLFAHPGPGWKVTSAADVLGPGVDVRGDGGYIVLSGGRHRSGRRYAWVRGSHPTTTPLASLPSPLRDLIARPCLPAGEIGADFGADTCYRENGGEQRSTEEYIGNHARPPGDAGAGLSVLSVLSVTPSSGSNLPRDAGPGIVGIDIEGQVAEAIASTLPLTAGQRNRCLFEFARALHAIQPVAAQPLAALKPLVRRWHAAALPTIGTKPFEDTWVDFAYGWPRVRHARGDGVLAAALAAADAAVDPPEAAVYDSSDTRRLIRLCRELQRIAGTGPFYLSCDAAAVALGLDKMTAWRRLNVLTLDGLLQVVSRHTARHATRYRYVGPLCGGSSP